MSAAEIASLIASIVSVGIAVLAIWLSVVFYKLTTESSNKINDSAKEINSGVERLEKLFNTLYTDTFSMMKDTVTDMRKHAWPDVSKSDERVNQEVEKKADEKVKMLKQNVDVEVGKLLAKQGQTDAKVDSLKGDLAKIVNSVIDKSRKVEIDAKKDTLREVIMSSISNLVISTNKEFSANTLFSSVNKVYPDLKVDDFLSEMEKLKQDKILDWTDKNLRPATIIKMKT
jgi:hypothetical protein